MQNFLALIISIIFSVYLIIAIFLNGTIPEFMKGMRYIATCGLIVAMFIYIVFLSANNNNLLSEKDFTTNFNPKKANFILHYFCPIISLLSFVLFERQIDLTKPEWTAYVAVPSCIYWLTYIILSATNLWEEPYDFTLTKQKRKNHLLEIFVIMIIPLLFILISNVLWEIK